MTEIKVDCQRIFLCIKIRGMTCSSCSKLIESTLKKLRGVDENSVKVDVMISSAIIVFDQSKINENIICEKIELLGFKTQIIEIRKCKVTQRDNLTQLLSSFSNINNADHRKKNSNLSHCYIKSKGCNLSEKDKGRINKAHSIRDHSFILKKDKLGISSAGTLVTDDLTNNKENNFIDSACNNKAACDIIRNDFNSYDVYDNFISISSDLEKHLNTQFQAQSNSYSFFNSDLSNFPSHSQISHASNLIAFSVFKATATPPSQIFSVVEEKQFIRQIQSIEGVISFARDRKHNKNFAFRLLYNPYLIKIRELLKKIEQEYQIIINVAPQSITLDESDEAFLKYRFALKEFLKTAIPALVVLGLVIFSQHFHQYLPYWLEVSILPGITFYNFIISLLSFYIQFFRGFVLHKNAFQALCHYSANMNTLISLSTNIAFCYSCAILIFCFVDRYFNSSKLNHKTLCIPHFFDTSALLITVVLFGRMIEEHAKSKAVDYIHRLVSLRKKVAILVKNYDGNSNEKERMLKEKVNENEKEKKATLVEVEKEGKEKEKLHRTDAVAEEIIPLDLVQVNDILKIESNAVIPVDGVIINRDSSCYVNESILTGEEQVIFKTYGSFLIGGCTVQQGTAFMRVTHVGSSTVLQRILSVVQRAQMSRCVVEEVADKIGKYFVLFVLLFAVLTSLIWSFILYAGFVNPYVEIFQPLENAQFFSDAFFPYSSTLYKVMFVIRFFVAVCTVACPCAFGLAAPTARIVSLAKSAEWGVINKSCSNIELAQNSQVIVLDKTGTITTGKLKLNRIVILPKRLNEVFSNEKLYETLNQIKECRWIEKNKNVEEREEERKEEEEREEEEEGEKKKGEEEGEEEEGEEEEEEDEKEEDEEEEDEEEEDEEEEDEEEEDEEKDEEKEDEEKDEEKEDEEKDEEKEEEEEEDEEEEDEKEKTERALNGKAAHKSRKKEKKMNNNNLPIKQKETNFYEKVQIDMIIDNKMFDNIKINQDSVSYKKQHCKRSTQCIKSRTKVSQKSVVSFCPSKSDAKENDESAFFFKKKLFENLLNRFFLILWLVECRIPAHPISRCLMSYIKNRSKFVKFRMVDAENLESCISYFEIAHGEGVQVKLITNSLIKAGKLLYVCKNDKLMNKKHAEFKRTPCGKGGETLLSPDHANNVPFSVEKHSLHKNVDFNLLKHWIRKEQKKGNIVAVLSIDGNLIGGVSLKDFIPTSSVKAIKYMQKNLKCEVCMCTGDSYKAAKRVGLSVGLKSDYIVADMLPYEKVEFVNMLKSRTIEEVKSYLREQRSATDEGEVIRKQEKQRIMKRLNSEVQTNNNNSESESENMRLETTKRNFIKQIQNQKPRCQAKFFLGFRSKVSENQLSSTDPSVSNSRFRRVVCMIGDGVNDALALKSADLGVCIGSASEITLKSSDIVITKHNIIDFVNYIRLCKATVSTIRRNFVYAGIFNAFGIPLAAGVLYPYVTLSPVVCVLLMLTSSLTVISSSLFLKKYKKISEEKRTAKKKNPVKSFLFNSLFARRLSLTENASSNNDSHCIPTTVEINSNQSNCTFPEYNATTKLNKKCMSNNYYAKRNIYKYVNLPENYAN